MMQWERAAAFLVGVAGVVVASGCGGDKGTPAAAHVAQSADAGLIDAGRRAYETYCVGCHGIEGDGRGEAAMYLAPKPRNFQLANFKFSSTRAGRLPTDEDLRRTITEGLKGSSMPRWNLLPLRTVDALVAYIKTFSPKWEERQPAPRIPVANDPYRRADDKTEAIRRGEAVYHGYSTCWTCHPAYVETERINEYLVAFGGSARDTYRENLGEALAKPNTEGEVIFPPDFLRDYVRAGTSVEILYRSIAGGITGTAMPTWIDSMDYPGAHEGDPPLVQPVNRPQPGQGGGSAALRRGRCAAHAIRRANLTTSRTGAVHIRAVSAR